MAIDDKIRIMNHDVNPDDSHEAFVKKTSLGGIFATFLKKNPRGVKLGEQLLGWHDIVTAVLGGTLRTRSQAVRIHNNCLIVTCTDSQTVSECFLHKEELLAAYRNQFSPLLFSKLHFVYNHDPDGNKGTRTASPQVSDPPVASLHHPHASEPSATPHSHLRQRSSPPPLTRGLKAPHPNARTAPPHAAHPKSEVATPASSKTISAVPSHGYKKWVSEAELRTYYPDVGLASGFLDVDHLG